VHNIIVDSALAYWQQGRKTKVTSGGWISGNAPCCTHRGESADVKGRGGIILEHGGESFVYHCFNCSFSAGWSKDKLLSENTRLLFKWLGMNDSDIGKLNLYALKLRSDIPELKKLLSFELKEIALPDDCKPVNQWLNEGCKEPELLAIVDYITNVRKLDWEWYPWHWSTTSGYKDRVIIPFYHEGKVVGYTGRKIIDGKPRFLTHSQNGYVFNLDAQTYDRKYVIVVEGQFDAIAIDGVAIMHNDPNEIQCTRINMLGREVIVVPDRDRAGAKMLKAVSAHNWSCSSPPWEDDIKDVADAVQRYGRLYTLATILHYRGHGEIKTKLLKKKLEGLHE